MTAVLEISIFLFIAGREKKKQDTGAFPYCHLKVLFKKRYYLLIHEPHQLTCLSETVQIQIRNYL
jgi:hypothetical protein